MFRIMLLLLLFGFTNCEKSQNLYIQTFEVKSGDTMESVTRRLIDDNIITSRTPFRIYGKITGQENKLKSGTYSLPPNASYGQLFQILTSGKSIGTLVTIPEGFNIFQIAYVLEQNEIISAKEFLKEVYDNKRLQNLGIPTNHTTNIQNLENLKLISDKSGFNYLVPQNPPLYSLEGYLFPDTYSFSKGCPSSSIVQAMLERFDEVVDNSIIANIKEQGKTLNEIIILASIIQKESSSEAEMPKVSGVYNNRLDISMILQADPTLIYALILDGEYDGNIRTRHVRPPWRSPYNTYYNQNLPPGAIANPGKSAILAAITPEKHDYLYFVATPNGGHQYSRTYKEHQKAVNRWVRYLRTQ